MGNFKKIFTPPSENNVSPSININLIIPEGNPLVIKKTLSNLIPSVKEILNNPKKGSYKLGNNLPNISLEKYPCNNYQKCNSKLEFCNQSKMRCECVNGFKRNNATGECIDIDECIDFAGKVCQFPNTHCENVIGSYHCRCDHGYIGDGVDCKKTNTNNFTKIFNEHINYNVTNDKEVIDNDEKDLLENIPMNKKFRSLCPTGFVRSKKTNKCEDINECILYKDYACKNKNARCRNIPGAYYCECKEGYFGDGRDCYPNSILLSTTTKATTTTNNGTLSNEPRIKTTNNITKCSDSNINKCNRLTELCIDDCGVIKCICKKGYLPINGTCQLPQQLPTLKSTCNGKNITMFIPYYQLPIRGYLFVDGMADKQECSKYYDTTDIKTQENDNEKLLYLHFSFFLPDCITTTSNTIIKKGNEQIKSLGFVTVHDYYIPKYSKKKKFEINCTNKVF
uniref:EGF-like domain-containing protein n=1 Tax=Strongyloides papillosus TaxID=174720 RepID=A0A0N5B5T7_STREA